MNYNISSEKQEGKGIPFSIEETNEEGQIDEKKSFKIFDLILNKHRKFYIWVSSVIVMLTVTIICHRIFIIDKAVFVLEDTDSYSQFMQFFPFLQDAFAKGQPFWSFNYGLGGNIFGEFSYYYTTSPYFYLMLIPRIITGHHWDFHEALFAKMVISLLKQFLCMFFTFSLLKYEGRKTINALVGAVVYGASLMFARYAVAFDIFTDPYPWVPLTILGFNVYKRTKKPFLLVLGAALTVGNSFYFGFMSFCLYFLYMIFFVIEARGKNLKERIICIFQSCYKYFLYAILAICIASVFLLPSLYALFNSDRFSQILNINMFWGSDFYKQLPERLFNNRDILAFPFIITMVIFLPITKVSKETRRKTLLAALFFLFYLFPYAYSFFSGLSHTYDRWIYLFIFTVAYAIPNWLEEDEKFKFTGFRFAVCGGALLIAMYASKSYRGAGGTNDLDKIFVVLSIISILAVATSIYFSKKYQYLMLRLILFICVASNMIVYSTNYFETVEGIRIQDQAFQQLGIENYEEMAIFKDLTPSTNDFYRDIFVDLTSQNAPLNYGYYGVSTFNSLINGDLHKWMKRDFNILQKIVITSLYLNLDDRLFVETALGLKYKVCLKDEYFDSYGYKLIRTSDNYDVYENQNIVGLDMWYDTITSDETFENENYAQRDAMLLQSAVVDREIQDIPYAGESKITKKVEIDWSRAQYTNIEYKDDYITAQKDASIIVPLKNDYKDDNGEMICSVNIVPNNGQNVDLRINDKLGNKASEDWTWTYPINDFTFKFNGATESLNITINEGTYKVNRFETYFNSYDNYEQNVKNRNKYNLENLYVNGGNVRGDINNNEKGILALSIPLDKGWTAKVDGKRQEIIRVNRAFSGLVLDPGNHHIELSYVSPGFKLGAFITILSLAGCTGVYFYNKKIKPKSPVSKLKIKSK